MHTVDTHVKGPSSKPVAERRLSLGRAVLRGVGLLILILAGFLVVLYSLQDRVIFPGASTQGTPEAIVHPPAGAELVTLVTPRADKVTALFGGALSSAGRPLADPMSRPAL